MPETRLIFTFLMCIGILPFFAKAQENPHIHSYPVQENDTLRYTISLVTDASGTPQYFFRNIFTPVCFTGECKPVYINFYWDLLGNYERYDLPPREVLTKMDHEEFTREDYAKLQEILANPSSLLGEIALEDLVSTGTDNLADSVDAKTGATLKTIKKEVIEGAVYTCYTLWRLAHSEKAIAEMRRITTSKVTPDLLHSFLRSGNYHYQYWALDRVIDDQGIPDPSFKAEIRNIIEGKNIFAARSTLLRLHPDVFTPGEQQWLWRVFLDAPYAFQQVVLKRLQTLRLSPWLMSRLVEWLPGANPEQFNLGLQLLGKQDNIPQAALKQLAGYLKSEPDARARAIHRFLAKTPGNKGIQAELDAYPALKQP